MYVYIYVQAHENSFLNMCGFDKLQNSKFLHMRNNQFLQDFGFDENFQREVQLANNAIGKNYTINLTPKEFRKSL